MEKVMFEPWAWWEFGCNICQAERTASTKLCWNHLVLVQQQRDQWVQLKWSRWSQGRAWRQRDSGANQACRRDVSIYLYPKWLREPLEGFEKWHDLIYPWKDHCGCSVENRQREEKYGETLIGNYCQCPG